MDRIDGSGPVQQAPETEVETAQPVGKGNIKAVEAESYLMRAIRIAEKSSPFTALRDRMVVQVLPKTHLEQIRPKRSQNPAAQAASETKPKADTEEASPKAKSAVKAKRKAKGKARTSQSQPSKTTDKALTSQSTAKSRKRSRAADQEPSQSAPSAKKQRLQGQPLSHSSKAVAVDKKPADLTLAHETEAVVAAARDIIDHKLAILGSAEDKGTVFKDLVSDLTVGEYGLDDDEASELKQSLSQACKDHGVRDLSEDPEQQVLLQKYVREKLVQSQPSLQHQVKQPAKLEELSKQSPVSSSETQQAEVDDVPQYKDSHPSASALPRRIRNTLERALKSDDPAYVVKKIGRYVEKTNDIFLKSGKGAPSPAQQQALYQGLIRMGTRLLILQNPVPSVEKSPEGKPNDKKRLALEAEGLWKMRNAVSNPKADLINTQATVMVQGGLLPAEEKNRLLSQCFGIIPVAIPAREGDVISAQNKRDKLVDKLSEAPLGSQEARELSDRLENQLATIERLTTEVNGLKAARRHGMKTNDDLFQDCHANLLVHLEKRLGKNYSSYLSKPLSSGAKERLRSPDVIVERIGESLLKKARKYATDHHGDKDGKTFEQREQEALAKMTSGITAVLNELTNKK